MREEMVTVLIIRIAIIIAIFIMINNLIKRSVIVAVLITSSSPHNKD